MADVVIEEGAQIEYSIIDENTVICSGAQVGEPKESGKGIAVLSRNIIVVSDAIVEGGAMVDKDVTKGGK